MKTFNVGTKVYFISYYWTAVVESTIKYVRTASSAKRVLGLQTSDCPKGMITEVYEEDLGVYFTEILADGEKLVACTEKPMSQRGAEYEIYVERMRSFENRYSDDGKLA